MQILDRAGQILTIFFIISLNLSSCSTITVISFCTTAAKSTSMASALEAMLHTISSWEKTQYLLSSR